MYNKKTYKVSVIIPLYNAASFLDKALNSVVNQTFDAYEIICVDDCSKDNTVKIVSKYSEWYDNIKLIHNKERKGAAYSRNIGIEEAVGEYLFFFDGDDLLDPSMIELSVKKAIETETDVVIVPASAIDGSDCFLYNISDPFERYAGQIVCGKEIEPTVIATFITSPWNKLFRTEFIKKRGIRFQSLKNANDVFFSMMSVLLAEKIVYLKNKGALVNWRQHDSKDRISRNRDPKCVFLALSKIIRELAEIEIDLSVMEGLYLHSFIFLTGQCRIGEGNEDYYSFLSREGIPELIHYSRGLFSRIEKKYGCMLSRFMNEPYKTRWFDEENYITAIIRADDHKIWSLWDRKRRIALWGAGRNGRALMKIIHEKNKEVCVVIDSNPKKANGGILGTKISLPDERLFDNIDAIIVTTNKVDTLEKEATILTKKGIQVEYLIKML
jgi:glycosyltransferase involved in cell wall biosynthesis